MYEHDVVRPLRAAGPPRAVGSANETHRYASSQRKRDERGAIAHGARAQSAAEQRHHVADGAIHADQRGPRHDAVADVQLHDLGMPAMAMTLV